MRFKRPAVKIKSNANAPPAHSQIVSAEDMASSNPNETVSPSITKTVAPNIRKVTPYRSRLSNAVAAPAVTTEPVTSTPIETFGWLAAIVLHSATVPSMLAVMAGLTDRLPGVDLVLLVWTGLTLLFVKATIQKDMLNIVTIGFGFIIQATLMALIFFK
mgnify:CR=1 FL=1